MRTRLRLPDAARTPLSLAGMALATAAAAVFLALLALELAGYVRNPYLGLVAFGALPLLFVVGLLLVPAGAWWAARRRGRLGAPPEWPVLDLRDGRQRSLLVGVLALTVVNLLIVSIGVYGGVHYMESAAFCGQVCHTSMEPQAVAHLAWPHARVSCTECHIGPGTGAFVEAKLAGTRRLLHEITGRVPRPVPPPGGLVQPAAVICQQCHAAGLRAGEALRVVREYRADEASSEVTTTLRLKVGDRTSGIHRHLSMAIEFPADDPAAATVPWVRVIEGGRVLREYRAAGAATSGTPRTMDCTDCHNRPAHTFSATPERAVDAALEAGVIPRELPFARREAVAAVGAAYDTRAAALAGIAERLGTFYRSRGTADAALVERAVAGAQQTWTSNVFPAMRVTWGTYPSHLGHTDSPGCFRCHDDRRSTDGRAAISQECELCHSLPE